jgi:hypothetical protein
MSETNQPSTISEKRIQRLAKITYNNVVVRTAFTSFFIGDEVFI